MGTSNRYERLIWDLIWVLFCIMLAVSADPTWLTITLAVCGGAMLQGSLQDFYEAKPEVESNDVESS